MKAQLQIPPKLIPVFTGQARYRGAYGGRGSGKTRTFALMTAVRAMMFAQAGQRGVILCGREFMNSLEESSMEEVKEAIRSVPWLNAYFEIGEKFIRTKNRRVSYVFAGLRHNLNSIKSKARILIAWIDEAESVSKDAWEKLRPTVRADNSEIWVTWNPEDEESATSRMFRENAPPDSKIAEINYNDNPWFPCVLEKERIDDLGKYDINTYAWIWEGAYKKNSAAQILANKVKVSEFAPEPGWDGPYFGIDWGFADDPTAGVKLWINGSTLYVEHEAYGQHVENDDLADLFIRKLPGIKDYVSRADNARPETISHVKSPGKHGRAYLPRIQACEKWPGSVEDGIAHLKSYKQIVVHQRCVEWIREAKRYSYKVDRNTKDILPDIIDKFNHLMDATRYALGPMIKRNNAVAKAPVSFFR